MAQFVAADWEDTESLIQDLIDALETFGVHMYPDPNIDGGDTYGFILSKEEMSEDDLQTASDKYWGISDL